MTAIVDLFLAGKITATDQPRALAAVAAMGGPDALRVVFDRAIALAEGDPAREIALLELLLKAASERHARPTGDLKAIIPLATDKNDGIARLALRLAGAWRWAPAEPALVAVATDASAPLDRRSAAMQGLAGLGSPAAKKTLEALHAAPSSRFRRVWPPPRRSCRSI